MPRKRNLKRQSVEEVLGKVRRIMNATASENGTADLQEPEPSPPEAGASAEPRKNADLRKLGLVLSALAIICISVILSVIVTILVLSVAESGVLLPQYSRYNQPTKISQLGFCVSTSSGHIRIYTAQIVGYCSQGRYVYVQPQVMNP
jgi:hypothetical protein